MIHSTVVSVIDPREEDPARALKARYVVVTAELPNPRVWHATVVGQYQAKRVGRLLRPAEVAAVVQNAAGRIHPEATAQIVNSIRAAYEPSLEVVETTGSWP